MSSTPSSSANTAASALLRLTIALIGTVGTMNLLVHFGSSLPFGMALLYGTAIVGGILIVISLTNLARELTQSRAEDRKHEHNRDKSGGKAR